MTVLAPLSGTVSFLPIGMTVLGPLSGAYLLLSIGQDCLSFLIWNDLIAFYWARLSLLHYQERSHCFLLGMTVLAPLSGTVLLLSIGQDCLSFLIWNDLIAFYWARLSLLHYLERSHCLLLGMTVLAPLSGTISLPSIGYDCLSSIIWNGLIAFYWA